MKPDQIFSLIILLFILSLPGIIIGSIVKAIRKRRKITGSDKALKNIENNPQEAGSSRETESPEAYPPETGSVEEESYSETVDFPPETANLINRSYKNGYEYEKYVASKIMATGNFRSVAVTTKSGDYGVDILCEEDDGTTWAVQCKMYSEKVGYKAIQEVVSGMQYYSCKRAAVYTTSTFTAQAKDAAAKMNVLLFENFS